MTVSTFVSWVLTHKLEALTDVGAIVGAASALVKSLEAFVALLVTLFPALQSLDGRLKGIAAVLDAASKWGPLNVVALSPKKPVDSGVALNSAPALKALLVALALGVGLHAAPAQAQGVLVSSGPTLPLMEIRPGYAHPVQLAAGAGYQLSLTLPQLQRAIAGRAWDLADLNLMAFGSAVSNSSGETFGALSAAVGLCTLSSLICGGVGHDLATSQGTMGKWFFVFALSVNFDTAPQAPPTGVDYGTAGMVRGNHLYFGAP